METNSSGSDRWTQHFDWGFLGLIVVLSTLGLMTIYSSTFVDQSILFWKQLAFVLLGLSVAFVVSLIDYRIFERLAWPTYGVMLLLLLAVGFFGKTSYGSQRWLDLGLVHLQPSELAKLGLIFVLARFFSLDKSPPLAGYGIKELLPVFVIMLVPMGMVFVQPDLGTTLMMGLVAMSVVFFCHLRTRTLLIMIGFVVVAAPLAYQFVLKEYQRDRVRTFLDPQRDPLGEGYHSIQSMIAVGSGELFGKGYLQGTQSKLQFLPKHHTDFIFSAFAEEWGFLGSAFVLSLFVLMVLMGVDIARKAKDRFGTVLAIGSVSLLAWHVIVNIGMEIGVLPVVGVTLPFFSYGGSSMMTNMLAVGILLSVSYRRHIF